MTDKNTADNSKIIEANKKLAKRLKVKLPKEKDETSVAIAPYRIEKQKLLPMTGTVLSLGAVNGFLRDESTRMLGVRDNIVMELHVYGAHAEMYRFELMRILETLPEANWPKVSIEVGSRDLSPDGTKILWLDRDQKAERKTVVIVTIK
jgi:hypothetical protein